MMLSIIIPVAREGLTLYDRIRLFQKELEKLAREYRFQSEIILVSDVLHAPTIKAMKMLAEQRIAKCFLLTRRIGKGGSIKNIIPYSRGDYLVLLDADLPVSVEIVVKAAFIASKSRAELLVANRVYREHALIRRILSIGYNALVDILFRTGLKDHQAGFKILSRRAAEIILRRRTRTDGLTYDTEVIVWARKHGFKTKIINVVWKEVRASSNIPPLRAMLTMLADLIMLRLTSIGIKYVALQALLVGKIIELSTMKTIGEEFITVIRASGLKKYVLDVLRKLYLIVAFRRKQEG